MCGGDEAFLSNYIDRALVIIIINVQVFSTVSLLIRHLYLNLINLLKDLAMQNLCAIDKASDGCLSDGTDVLYNKFNVSGSSPPDNPPRHPNSDYSCVVATTGHWKVTRCDDRHQVVCQYRNSTLSGITS